MTDPLTVANLLLIGLFAVAAVIVIIAGARFKRRRVAAEQHVIERREAADVPSETAPAPAGPTPPPPVAPAPPPSPTQTPPPSTAGSDDITQLKGLGPKLAATLAQLGYTRIGQIAALTPDEAAALDAQLGAFQGRMARDRWIEQATLLAAGDRAGYEAAFGKLG